MHDLDWDKDFNPLAKVISGRVGLLLEVEQSPTVDCIWQLGLHDPDWAESHFLYRKARGGGGGKNWKQKYSLEFYIASSVGGSQ